MISVSFRFCVNRSFLKKRSQHPIHISRGKLGHAYRTLQTSGFARAERPGQVLVIFPQGERGCGHIYSGANNRGPYLQLKVDGEFPRIPEYFKLGDDLLVVFTELLTSTGYEYYAILERDLPRSLQKTDNSQTG